jgi:hypothetical protein
MSTTDPNNPAGRNEDTSMISGLEGEGAKLLIERTVPKLMDYGKMLFFGRRFLVLGPARSGKTNFSNFLEYLILEREKPTPPTVRVHKGPDRLLRLGPDRNLILRIRKPRDVAGQEPIQQMPYIEDYLPHCIVIVLDASRFFGVTAPYSDLEWLQQFCGHFDILLRSNSRVAMKLKSMTVVMNKWDKMDKLGKTQTEKDENQSLCEFYIRNILDDSLHNTFYVKGGANNIDVVPCCLVSGTPLGDALAKLLVQTVALSLSRQ